MSLHIFIVSASLIYFLSWEWQSNFSVIFQIPISTAFPVLLHLFSNRIQSCPQRSGCEHAVTWGRGVKVLSVLFLVPFVGIRHVFLFSPNTAEPWAGATKELLASFSQMGLSVPIIRSHLLTEQIKSLLKCGESDTLSCLKVVILILIWSASGWFFWKWYLVVLAEIPC